MPPNTYFKEAATRMDTERNRMPPNTAIIKHYFLDAIKQDSILKRLRPGGKN